MKKLSPLIILCLGLSTAQARADASQVAAVAVGALAATAAMNTTLYTGTFANELEEWKSSRIDSTVQLASGCDVGMETHLLGHQRGNIAYIALENSGKQAWVLKPNNIRFIFGSGKERLTDFGNLVDPVEFKENRHVLVFAEFPSKLDFENQNQITIEVPFYKTGNDATPSCVIKTTMIREAAQPRYKETITESTVISYTIEGGLSPIRMGDLGAISQNPQFAFNLIGYIYGSLFHGMFYGLTANNFGGKYSAMQAATGTLTNQNPDFYSFAVDLGYSFRYPLGSRFFLNADLGLALQDFLFENTASEAGTARKTSVWTAAVLMRLAVDWRFAQIRGGFWTGDYFAGLVLQDSWTPSVALGGGVSAAGQLPSILLRLGIGI